jgi:hypothetical protein
MHNESLPALITHQLSNIIHIENTKEMREFVRYNILSAVQYVYPTNIHKEKCEVLYCIGFSVTGKYPRLVYNLNNGTTSTEHKKFGTSRRRARILGKQVWKSLMFANVALELNYPVEYININCVIKDDGSCKSHGNVTII